MEIELPTGVRDVISARTVTAAARGGSGMLGGWDCVMSALGIRVHENIAELGPV